MLFVGSFDFIEIVFFQWNTIPYKELLSIIINSISVYLTHFVFY